jgi:uridine phosphorylase
MERKEYPILEFDPSPTAIIEASCHIEAADVPEHCVPCFFQDVIRKLVDDGRAKEIACMGSEMGRHPLYEVVADVGTFAVYQPGVSAAFAAAMLEEVIALGCRKFIACGGGGVLDREIAVGHIIVPTAAVRDEGASYHYMPPSREVAPSPEGLAAIEKVLQARNIDYILSKTWTTDGFYRETREKIEMRRSEGCLIVEMEAAAFFAVAQFRGVTFAQILYGGDDVSGEEWDHRDWHKKGHTREELLWLAAEACLEL